MKPTLIGLLGRAGSGKSTVAAHLEERCGAFRYSLAGPLKALSRYVFDLSEDQVYGTQAAKEAIDPRWGLSPRELLIRVGHGMREHFGEGVHLAACLDRIRRDGAALSVVEDVRYPNEARGIVNNDGRIIKLVCPDAGTAVDPNAPSERSVDEVPEQLIARTLWFPRSPGGARLVAAVDELIAEWGLA